MRDHFAVCCCCFRLNNFCGKLLREIWTWQFYHSIILRFWGFRFPLCFYLSLSFLLPFFQSNTHIYTSFSIKLNHTEKNVAIYAFFPSREILSIEFLNVNDVAMHTSIITWWINETDIHQFWFHFFDWIYNVFLIPGTLFSFIFNLFFWCIIEHQTPIWLEIFFT